MRVFIEPALAPGSLTFAWAMSFRETILEFWKVDIVRRMLNESTRSDLMFCLVWARGEFKLCSVGIPHDVRAETDAPD